MRKTVAIQAGGYLLLLALIYEWLGIADRSVWQVLLSGLLGLAIVCGAVWLIARAVVAPSRKSLLWLLAAAAAVVCCVWLAGYQPRVGLRVASQLTQWFRKPVKPQTMSSLYVAMLWMTGITAVLALLPRASQAPQALRQWRYWAMGAVLVAAGFILPTVLIGWVPKFQSFGAQTASMIVRLALAYAIALAAWLAIASLPRRIRKT